MLDDNLVFSQIQPITVSAPSNYPGTGGPSPGVFDTIGVVPSPGGSGGFGQMGVVAASPIKFTITASIAQIFQGPVNATLLVQVQDSPDNVNWSVTDMTEVLAENLAALQIPGQIIITSVIPAIGGSTNPPGVVQRYIRIFYVVANGPFTAGAVNARIDMM